ncbi:MAG: hypothetical protein IKR04_02825 [Clostridia bacterium]|nr:hypothetical protein [Clostridia bacterium]
MKRELKIIVFVIIFIICSILLSGCANQNNPEYLEENFEFGSYHLYKTDDANRYLKFLESFDDTKFEIVDISYGYQDHVDNASKHDEFLVTYRSR